MDPLKEAGNPESQGNVPAANDSLNFEDFEKVDAEQIRQQYDLQQQENLGASAKPGVADEPGAAAGPGDIVSEPNIFLPELSEPLKPNTDTLLDFDPLDAGYQREKETSLLELELETERGPEPSATIGGSEPAATIGGPEPSDTIGGPEPLATIGDPEPSAIIVGPEPPATIGGPVPSATIGGPEPSVTIEGPILQDDLVEFDPTKPILATNIDKTYQEPEMVPEPSVEKALEASSVGLPYELIPSKALSSSPRELTPSPAGSASPRDLSPVREVTSQPIETTPSTKGPTPPREPSPPAREPTPPPREPTPPATKEPSPLKEPTPQPREPTPPPKEPTPPPREPTPPPREPTPPPREPTPPPPKEPTPPPKEPTPPPREPTPPPREPTPPPREPTPPLRQPSPPREPTPPPREPTPPPREPTPPPREPTPPPREPTPPPREPTPPPRDLPKVSYLKSAFPEVEPMAGLCEVSKRPLQESTISQGSPPAASRPRASREGNSIVQSLAVFDPFVNLIYWRDLKKSGIVFGSIMVILLSLAYLSLISVVAYTSLTVLTGTIAFRIYKNIMQAIQKSQDGHPFKQYLELDTSLQSDKVHEATDVIVSQLNSTVTELKRLFLVEDLIDSVKFGCLLWCLTYVGSWFNGLTLVILSVVALFSLPKVYEQNQAQIDQYLGLVRSHFNDIFSKVKAAIPIGNKESKESKEKAQ